MAYDSSASAGPQGYPDRNNTVVNADGTYSTVKTAATLPSGTSSSAGTQSGTTNQTVQTEQSQSSAGSAAVQNMTPEALAALQGLIKQLSDHPAVDDAAAELTLQAQGLRPPREIIPPKQAYYTVDAAGRANIPMTTYTDEKGNQVSKEQYQAAVQRYNQAKAQVISAGGTVAGGTEEMKKQAALKEQIIQSLTTEHATNIAATVAANTTNAATQIEIIKAYGDNVVKAAEAYDLNKGIVQNANAINKTQNDAAFQTYLANVTTAASDHQRNIQQNEIDRATAEQNLRRSQGLQDQELKINRAKSAEYSKEAAFNDASQLTAHYARVLSEQLMPTILRAQEASGTSGSATAALLAQDAAARVSEAAATTGLTAATQYGQVAAQLAGVNASLVNNSPQLQQTAPVAGIQQIAPVNPLNPALIQSVQQVQAPGQLAAQVANDSTTAALTNLTSSNPALDALIASLGVGKGAVSNSQTASSQNTSGTQKTAGTTNAVTTENKVQQGTPAAPVATPAPFDNPNKYAAYAQPAVNTAAPSMSVTNTTNREAQTPEEYWANYSFEDGVS